MESLLFSSIVFLYYFIPCFFLLYYITPGRYRNAGCLLASLFFYAWGEPYYVLLMILSIGVNYALGLGLDFDRSARVRKTMLVLACIYNLGMLFVFKYAGFFLQTGYDLFGVDQQVQQITLPLGISFYTFQALSYIIDVYRREVAVQKRPQDLALYVCMFPQLVAGPIVRYADVNNELNCRKLSVHEIAQGIFRFLIGLSKKVLLSNGLGMIADNAWLLSDAQRTVAMAWCGLTAYTLQIYFDFSGYSDMAIGLGKMLGFHFMENFNYPYAADSVSDFWRRWHISMGSWFRDYVYIPLGGNRVSRLKWLRNLLVVWGLTGFWHGANWTFLLWGLYYGVLLCAEKLLGARLKKIPAVLRHIFCILAVMCGWVLFRSDSVAQAFGYFGSLLGLNGAGFSDVAALVCLRDNGPLLLISAFGCLPLVKGFALRLSGRLSEGAAEMLRCGIMVALLALCTLYLVNSTYNPFIYFRF